MVKGKTIWMLLLLAAVCISSCGIFKKDCGCPHFGRVKNGNAKQQEKPVNA